MAEIELYAGDGRPVFNYEDAGEYAETLRAADDFIIGTMGGAYYDIAGKVKEVHSLLAKHGAGGTFTRWAAAHGWTRDSTAKMIRAYDFVNAHPEARQRLLALKKSALEEAARPSTPPEIVQGVLEGKVTTATQIKAMRGDEPKTAASAPNIDPCKLYDAMMEAQKEAAQKHKRDSEEWARQIKEYLHEVHEKTKAATNDDEYWEILNIQPAEIEKDMAEAVSKINRWESALDKVNQYFDDAKDPMRALVRYYQKQDGDEENRLFTAKFCLNLSYLYCRVFQNLAREAEDLMYEASDEFKPECKYDEDLQRLARKWAAQLKPGIRDLLHEKWENGTFDRLPDVRRMEA